MTTLLVFAVFMGASIAGGLLGAWIAFTAVEWVATRVERWCEAHGKRRPRPL